MSRVLVLLHFPAIVVALVASTFVLGAAGAAGPLFLASAASGSVDAEFDLLADQVTGLTVSTTGLDAGGPLAEALAELDRLVRDRAAEAERLGEATLTVRASRLTVGEGEASDRAVLLARSGAVDEVEILEGAAGEGVLVPASLAELQDLAPGDQLAMSYGDGEATATVVAVYRDVTDSELSDYWSRAAHLLPDPEAYLEGPPPPVVLAEQGQLLALVDALEDTPDATWDFDVRRGGLTLPVVERTRGQVAALVGDVEDPETEVGAALAEAGATGRGLETVTILPAVTARVRAVVAGLTGPITLVALAACGVGLVVVAAAAMFAARARAGELRLRGAQGIVPGVQGLRAGLEALLPSSVGVLAGFEVSRRLVALAGPGALVEEAVVGRALRTAVALGVVAVVVVAVSTGVTARRVGRPELAARRSRLARMPWELVPLTLAGAALYQIALRGEAVVGQGGNARADVLVVAFPLLLVAGLVGLAARGVRRLLPSLRAIAHPARPVRYLAARRLAGAPGTAVGLVGVAALATGILVYAATVATSTAATVSAKGEARVGAPVVARLGPGEGADPSGLGIPATLVRRARGQGEPGQLSVDVLALDPATFADVADLAATAGPEGEALLDRLTGGDPEPLRVLVAGGGGTLERLLVEDADLDLDVVGRVDAFPGLVLGDPLLVVDWEAIAPSVVLPATDEPPNTWNREVWAAGDPADALAAFESADVGVAEVTIASDVLITSGLQAFRWSLGFLEALGYLAGVLALAGMVLYLRARQQARDVAGLLTGRMGLVSATQRLAIGAELAAMLVTAVLLGTALALFASWLVTGRLDPLPDLPPDPVLALPIPVLLGLLPAVALASMVGAWWVQRRGERTDAARVMRLAE